MVINGSQLLPVVSMDLSLFSVVTSLSQQLMLLVCNVKCPRMMQQEIVSQPSASAICDISHSNSDLLCFIYHGTTMVTMQWFSMVLKSSQLFSVVLNHCQQFSIVHSSGQWLPVVLNGYSSSQLVSVVVKDSRLLSMITSGCQQILNVSQWFSITATSFQWFTVVVSGYQ